MERVSGPQLRQQWFQPLPSRQKPRLRTSVARLLRRQPNVPWLLTNFTRLLAYFARHQQPALRCHISGLCSHEPAVLAYFAKLLANLACVWLSYFPVILAYISQLLADIAFLLAHIAKLQPYFACASWRDIAALQPDVTRVQPDIACLQSYKPTIRCE